MQSNEIVYSPFNNQVLVSENHALLGSTYWEPRNNFENQNNF